MFLLIAMLVVVLFPVDSGPFPSYRQLNIGSNLYLVAYLLLRPFLSLANLYTATMWSSYHYLLLSSSLVDLYIHHFIMTILPIPLIVDLVCICCCSIMVSFRCLIILNNQYSVFFLNLCMCVYYPVPF